MKNRSSKNKLVITEEFIFYQNKLLKDLNNHFKFGIGFTSDGLASFSSFAEIVSSPVVFIKVEFVNYF